MLWSWRCWEELGGAGRSWELGAGSWEVLGGAGRSWELGAGSWEELQGLQGPGLLGLQGTAGCLWGADQRGVTGVHQLHQGDKRRELLALHTML